MWSLLRHRPFRFERSVRFKSFRSVRFKFVTKFPGNRKKTLRTGSPEMFGKEISRWFWDLDHHGEKASRKKIPTLRTGLSKLLTELFSRFFFRHQRKKRKKLHQHKKKMKQSWQPKCTSSSPHLLSFSHPQLELASVSPSLSLTLATLSLSFSLPLSLPLSPLCYSLSFLSSLCFCLRECLLLSM